MARPADDKITITMNEALLLHEAKRGATELLAGISFDSAHRPLLRKLGFLMLLISKFAAEYKLNELQCYWFCLTIMRVVEHEFEGADVKQYADPGRAGTFLGMPIRRGEEMMESMKDGMRDLYHEGAWYSIVARTQPNELGILSARPDTRKEPSIKRTVALCSSVRLVKRLIYSTLRSTLGCSKRPLTACTAI